MEDFYSLYKDDKSRINVDLLVVSMILICAEVIEINDAQLRSWFLSAIFSRYPDYFFQCEDIFPQ